MSSATVSIPAHLPKVEPFLLEVADVVNTTLDLDTLLERVAAIIRRVIDYDIFAILLLNDRSQDLRIRFSIGHEREMADKVRILMGEGVTGLAAARREAVLINDVLKDTHYIEGTPGVRSELAVPLIVKNKVIGVIDLEAPQPDYFTKEHKNLLTLVASRIAVGIENARLYTRVSRQAKSLTLLNEIARDLTSILNLDQLFKRIGEQLKRLMDYQMFSILMVDEAGQKLQHRFSLRYNENVHLKHDIPIGHGLVGSAVEIREPLLVPDVSKDPRYINSNPETRSELVVPMFYKDKIIGVLDIEHTKRGYFTEQHLRTMTTLAAQIAIAIENARLYEAIAMQEQRLERDLNLARQLQFRLLPQCCPEIKGAEIAAHFSPARFIGGDLYDFVKYNKGIALAIGDVSGKGAPAALYAAMVDGFLRSHAVRQPGAAQMMSAINTSLLERPIDAQYISMIYALYDEEQRLMTIANSGLPRPVYCHNGRVEMVEAAGLPMGLFKNAEYDEVTFHPAPGDLFLFFSDGMTDANNVHGKQFGRERLERIVAENCHKSAEKVVNALDFAVREFSAGVDPFDDQTILALKFAEPLKPTPLKSRPLESTPLKSTEVARKK
jgi:sigma-B regulation protein RsbU (phosphoserine phosphatase)